VGIKLTCVECDGDGTFSCCDNEICDACNGDGETEANAVDWLLDHFEDTMSVDEMSGFMKGFTTGALATRTEQNYVPAIMADCHKDDISIAFELATHLAECPERV